MASAGPSVHGITPPVRSGLFVVLVLLMAGCRSPVGPPVSEVVLDRGEAEGRRLAAVAGASLDGQEGAQTAAALHVLVWSDRHPLALRVAAMDRLIEHDTEAFWAAADRWLGSVDDAAMLEAIGDRAIAGGRREAAAFFVEHWATRAPLEGPPRAIYLRVLSELFAPDQVEDVLWSWVCADGNKGEAERGVHAWGVLAYLMTEADVRERLADQAGDTALVVSLRQASQVVDRLPRHAEGLRWLAALRERPVLWAAMTERRQELPATADEGLELRHWPALLALGTTPSEASRGRWEADILGLLQGTKSYAREVPAGRTVSRDEAGLVALSWPDVAMVWSVTQAIREPAVVAAWFAQADADLADTSTEYGGVLTWDDGGAYVARGFAPQRTQGDHKFFSPPALIEAMYTGLAHYHFHAQRIDNAEFAGPGRGDLAFTEAMRANTLTLTFVDRDRLNVDLALPGVGVVDLGSIERPTPESSGD